MNIARRYYACRDCHATYTPWDRWAGLGDDGPQITEQARKVLVAVSTAWSFDRASKKLKDLCNLTVSDDTIELEGRLYELHPGRNLIPFYLWLAIRGYGQFDASFE